MNLEEWANEWGVSDDALFHLKFLMGINDHYLPAGNNHGDKSETYIQSELRVKASQQGIHLFRNNIVAAVDKTGRQIRGGLLNDSKKINAKIKSSDLIGIKPGGQFMAREVKKPGWVFDPNDEHEQAQLRFIELINAMGGDAKFTTGDL